MQEEFSIEITDDASQNEEHSHENLFNDFFGVDLSVEPAELPEIATTAFSNESQQFFSNIHQVYFNYHEFKKIEEQIETKIQQISPLLIKQANVELILGFLNNFVEDCHIYGGAANCLSKNDGDIDVTCILNEYEFEKMAVKYFKDNLEQLENTAFPINDYLNSVKECNEYEENFKSCPRELLSLREKLRKSIILTYFGTKLKDFSPKVVPTARVPVLKIVVPINFQKQEVGDFHDKFAKNIAVDICVNNLLPLENTNMIQCYMKQNPHLKRMILIIKAWTSARDISSSINLNSYFFNLLVIYYLEQVGELNCLQPYCSRIIQGQECGFCALCENRCNESKKYTLAQLLLGFFGFYGYIFDFEQDVVSVRMGRAISKASKGWTTENQIEDIKPRDFQCPDAEPEAEELEFNDVIIQPIPQIEIFRHQNKYSYICVEDPFETHVNVGRNCDYRFSKLLGTEFKRAFVTLKREEGLDWLFIDCAIDPPGQIPKDSLSTLKKKQEDSMHFEVKVGGEKKKKFSLSEKNE